MRIRTQLIFILLVVIIFLITTFSFIIYNFEEKNLKKQIYSHLESVSEVKADRVRGIIKSRYEQASFPATNGNIIKGMENNLSDPNSNYGNELEPLLKQYISKIPSFQKIHLLNLQGTIIASSDSSFQGQNWSKYESFLITKTGRKFLDGFHFNEKNDLNVFLSSPILNNKGRMIGVLIIERDASEILSLTSNYKGLGKTGETALGKKYPDKILYLTPLRHDKDAALKRTLPPNENRVAMGMVLNSKSDIIIETIDYRGKKVLSSGKYIEESGWGMVTKIDFDEAMEPVYYLRRMLIIFNIAGIIVAVGIAYLIGTYFSRPLEKLNKSSIKIKEGDLSERAEVNRKDEIGILATSFNEMADKLSAKIVQTESFAASILDASLHGIVVFESVRDHNNEIIDFKYIFVNTTGEKILGRRKDDLVDKKWLEEYPGFRDLGLFEIQKNVVETGQAEVSEFLYQGQGFNDWFRNGFTRWNDGLIVSFENITTHKNTEIEIKKNEVLFKGLLESAPDAVIISNSKGEILIVNAQTENIFGYKREELIGNPIEILIPQRFREGHPKYRKEFFNTPESRPMGHPSKNLFGRRKDGKEFPVEVSLSPLKIGEALLVSAAIRDITPRIEIQNQLEYAQKDLQQLNIELEERVAQRTQELSNANNELKRINEDLDRFAYIVSHDLKTPVAAVEGLVNIIKEEYRAKPIDDEGAEVIAMVETKLEDMRGLIESVLITAKEKKVKVKGQVNLFNLTQEVIKTLNPPKYFHIFIQHTLPMVTYHKISINQVMQNLIGNAIKYMDKDQPLIKIGFWEFNRYYQICVSDNGPGISKEKQSTIFEMFETAHEGSREDSHGIGLSIVKRIVDEHGGRIWVESEEGKETHFYFTIPK